MTEVAEVFHNEFRSGGTQLGAVAVAPEDTDGGKAVLVRAVHVMVAESRVETAPKSLRLSCGSELTRQGISLP